MMLVWHRLNSAGTAYEAQGIIEDAHAVVWTERWQDYGEAQVDLPPTHDVRTGDLLTMPERDMAVEVVGRTETEKGVQLRCRDALSILDRRIVYPTVSNNGLVRTFVEKLLANGSIVTDGTTSTDRTLLPMRAGDLSAITASANLQRSYGHVGETLASLSRTYGFDPTCRLSGGLLTIGARASSVQRVWGMGRNLAGYAEDVDTAGYRNVAYVGAQEDEGGSRIVAETGDRNSANLDRREEFVDRRDLALVGLDLQTAEAMFGEAAPVGRLRLDGVTKGDTDPYDITEVLLSVTVQSRADVGFVQMNASMRMLETLGNTELVQEVMGAMSRLVSAPSYDGAYDSANEKWTVNFHPTTVDVPKSVLDSCRIDVVRQAWNRVLSPIGEEALADLQPETAFEAATEGLTPYVDYALGDQVAIYKADGSRKDMRVVEVVESWDSQGYRATPGLASL